MTGGSRRNDWVQSTCLGALQQYIGITAAVTVFLPKEVSDILTERIVMKETWDVVWSLFPGHEVSNVYHHPLLCQNTVR